MQLTRGKFITLEGGEGVGKSTQIDVVRDELQAAGIDVVITREPGGTKRAEKIRQLLLERSDEAMPESCELLLMFAARATHLHTLIVPALHRGAWVVCDRFTDASYAYQGYGRGLSLDMIGQLEHWVQQGLQPDLTLLLDAPIEQAMQRAHARNQAKGEGGDRFEAEQQAFFERVRHGYQARAGADEKRFRIIDASQPLSTVTESVRAVVREFVARA